MWVYLRSKSNKQWGNKPRGVCTESVCVSYTFCPCDFLTIVAQQKAKIIDGIMRPRSKLPPITSCTVTAQNSLFKQQNQPMSRMQ